MNRLCGKAPAQAVIFLCCDIVIGNEPALKAGVYTGMEVRVLLAAFCRCVGVVYRVSLLRRWAGHLPRWFESTHLRFGSVCLAARAGVCKTLTMQQQWCESTPIH